MLAATDRLEFAPPRTAGLVRALVLAVLAHAVLVAALTWGVRWKSETEIVTAQAELWAAVPQIAAPKLVEAPPAPPEPAPALVVPPPAAPKLADANIALEREKLRVKVEREQAAEKLERDRREKQKQALERQRVSAEKVAVDKKKAEQATRRKEELKAQQEAQQKEVLMAQQEAAKLEAQRKANLQRMAGLAGATGAPSSTGTAAQSAGPSASYSGKVQAKVRPHIVFTGTVSGDWITDVEVRTGADGTIQSRKIIKSSGNKAWDEAVLKALDKTEALPRDVNGNIPSPLVIGFRP